MSDLDDDLLALAGAGTDEEEEDEFLSTSKKHASKESSGSKRRRIMKDDEDEDEDEDDNDEEDDDGYMPADSFDNDEEEEEEEEETDSIPFPLEGKYKDEKDREKLELLPEMERESILFERSQQMQKYQERKLLRQHAKSIKQQQQLQREGSKSTRASTRSSRTTGHSDLKQSKLSELKKQRAKKSGNYEFSDNESEDDYRSEDDSRGRRRRGDYDDEEEEESEYDEEEDDYDLGYEKSKTRGRERADIHEVEWAEDDNLDRESSLDDYNKIQIGRSFVAKFCFYPHFNKIVEGCYGRVNIGKDKHTGNSMYRMVKIERVFLQKPYNMGKFFTNQYFGVTQGKDRKIFQMSYFSDSPVTQPEYERYLLSLEKYDITQPSPYILNNKSKAVNEFVCEPLTPKLMDDIVRNRMVFNKKLSGTNAVMEKQVLKEKLQFSKQSGDIESESKYANQLKALEKRLSSYEKHHENDQNDIKTLGALTSKNRKLNIDRIRHAETIKREEGVNKVDAKSDPFSRLKTRTKIYYQEIQQEENEKAREEAKRQLEVDQEAEEQKKKELLLAKFRRLGGLEEIIGSLDLKLHIDI
ncbi:RNA polymerase-associated protein [Kluyveromyces lactis]|uniref:KLLA0A00737p n=1 Tax=Kluyveromyces lactis (strain ATCC 8585 / CBS 2359 / DSM 70799 / NBRC 1267 / NRRL Y-1140 / WM37) TaxID=284590 RepID=Q6CYF8_KLULA|nr:uncharacterized protein KLLA0_A00737g [Kluyveromyces lactis]CAH02619.1 KLLA0A00737p [Kluyveromyces lactis]|eukprot:XP_451031.1 uncharacterized protein KLLA0_A00737g [Kluyveromyces lactis]